MVNRKRGNKPEHNLLLGSTQKSVTENAAFSVPKTQIVFVKLNFVDISFSKSKIPEYQKNF